MTTAIKKGIIYDELMTGLEKAKSRMKELEKELCVNDISNQINETTQLAVTDLKSLWVS